MTAEGGEERVLGDGNLAVDGGGVYMDAHICQTHGTTQLID